MPALFIAVALILPVTPLAGSPFARAAATRLSAARAGTNSSPVGSTAAAPPINPTATAAPRTAVPPAPIAEPTPPAHYVVLLVVDAGRPSYFNLGHLPHIQALMRNGVVYDRAFVGEMLSSTPNVHVTLGTGTYPRENGFLGFGWASPQTRRTVDFRSLLADGGVDPVLRSLPVPSVAARLHAMDPNAVSIAGSGHKDYAAVGLGGGAATYELYGRFVNHGFIPTSLLGHTPPPISAGQRKALTLRAPLPMGAEDRFAVRYALDVAVRTKPRLLMLNLPEVDTWGHWYGPDDSAVFTRLMEDIDADLGQIEDAYRRMGILGQTDFILTADHSMMESHAAHDWNDVWAAAGKTAVARADPDGGSIWLKDPTQAKQVAERLVALQPTHVEAIFYRSAPGLSYHYIQASPMSWLVNPGVGTALQHLVDTTAGRDGPDIWMLYREGYTTVPRNVRGMWKGTHGGSTWQVQHIPLVIEGPGIRQGVHSEFPARSIDIAPTMEYLLGLPPIHRDGVMLADALQSAPRPLLDAEAAIEPSLSDDVSALQAQSQLDLTIKGHWPKPPTPIFRCHLPSNGAKNPIISCAPPVSPTNE